MPTPTEQAFRAKERVTRIGSVLALSMAIKTVLTGCVPEGEPTDGIEASPNPKPTQAEPSNQTQTEAELLEEAGLEETEPAETSQLLLPEPTPPGVIFVSNEVKTAATPEKMEAMNNEMELFDAEAMGFTATYGLELVVLADGTTGLATPFDATNDAHFIFDAEAKRWINNHPGRIEIDNIMPEETKAGRNIYYELQGFEWDEEIQDYLKKLNDVNLAVWDQEHLSYRYTDTDADPGHENYFQPMMGTSNSDEQDIKDGRVTFVETFESEDFVPGESGVRAMYYLSDKYPKVEYYETVPADISSKAFSETLLKHFPWLGGQTLILRTIHKDITAIDYKIPNRETFFEGAENKRSGGWVTGFMAEVAPDVSMITISLDEDEPGKGSGKRVAIGNYLATFWTLRVQQDGIMTQRFVNECYDLRDEALGEITAETGLSVSEMIHVELQD